MRDDRPGSVLVALPSSLVGLLRRMGVSKVACVRPDPSCLAYSRRSALSVLGSALAWALVGCDDDPRQAAIPRGATVLAFGDSITHGTGAGRGEDWPTLLASFTSWNIINAGVPDDTALAGKGRIGPLLSQHQPALVIVGLGGNDFLRRRSADQVRDDLRDILRQVKSYGAPAVMLAIPPQPARRGGLQAVRRAPVRRAGAR